MTSSHRAAATRRIPAPASVIFDLLADPAQHHLIDGSGTVRGVQPGTPDRLSLGSTFRMRMKMGLPYGITNTVVEFEENRRIAWRHVGHHVWRYRLDPVGPDATEVTEEFDADAGVLPGLVRAVGAIRRNQSSIEQTLVRLEAWARSRSS